MESRNIFISYAFEDSNSCALMDAARIVVKHLPRVETVDANSLDLSGAFAERIISFIKNDALALLGVFTEGVDRNANIVFEVGVAVGAGKTVILVGNLDSIPTMLHSQDVVVVNFKDLRWESKFKERLERKLKIALQTDDDPVVEQKIKRRYSEEEMDLMKYSGRYIDVIEAIKSADLKLAIAMLDRRDPLDLDTIFLLSDSYYLTGLSKQHPEEREEWFTRQIETARRGLAIDSNNILLRHSVARGLVRLGELEEAQHILESIVRELPNYSIGFYDLACAYCKDGRYEKQEHISEILGLLGAAIERDSAWREYAVKDPDFVKLHGDRQWETLVFPQK